MFGNWRRFVVWLRGILFSLFISKKPIDWDEKGRELGEILSDTTEVLKKKEDQSAKEVSNYSIVPDPPVRPRKPSWKPVGGLVGIGALKVFSSNELTVKTLYFSAKWCGGCRIMRPIMEKLSNEGYVIEFIEFDDSREVARKYSVTLLPTIIVLRGNEEIAKFVGRVSEEQLRSVLPKPIKYEIW